MNLNGIRRRRKRGCRIVEAQGKIGTTLCVGPSKRLWRIKIYPYTWNVGLSKILGPMALSSKMCL